MKLTTKLSAAIMAALGFASCSMNDGDEPGIAMYGTPNAQFKLKSEVKDQAGRPIKGIGVTASGSVRMEGTTNENGIAESQTVIFPTSQKIMVYFTDTDGELNGGSFKKDSVEIVFNAEDFSRDKNNMWSYGIVEKSVKVTMKEDKR